MQDIPYPYSRRSILLSALLALALFSCRQSHTPKPEGQVRIILPEKEYHVYDEQAYASFEIPVYARAEVDPRKAGQGWLDLALTPLNGRIHLSYKPVDGNLGEYITDSRTLAYKHTVKAQGINETPLIERERNMFGMLYDLEGDVASSVQFFITDSTTHFLRGSLYFNCSPNQDSLRPVVKFVREDILHLIKTVQWKYE